MVASLMALTLHTANAAVVEHIGDRYIINVEEMDLSGEESIMDLLLMCPEVITLDAKAPMGAGLYGGYGVRIDNIIGFNIDVEAFLKNTKAREVKCIKICQNPGVMKGCGGLKQVIDINLRKGENGTSGRVALEGDSYGEAGAYVTALHQTDGLRLLGIAEGNLSHEKSDAGVKSHGGHQAVKLNMVWDITSKDMLELDLSQNFNRSKVSADPAAYNRNIHLEGTYLRTLSDKGSYALVQMGGNYYSDNTVGMHSKSTDPFAVFEFAFPLGSPNLWMTAGIESGYSASTDAIADFTNRSRYEDGYVQLDWTVGNWGFMLGDRFRVLNYWMQNLSAFNEFEHTTSNHAYTASAYYKFDKGHTLQGTFARRYYNPGYDNYVTEGMAYSPIYEKMVDGKVYTTDYDHNIAYVSELKYTYSKSDFVFGGLVKNIRQDLEVGHDNTLSVGATAFWKTGVLRLTAGANYFWQKTTYSADNKEYNNFVNLKLAPQVTLDNGWRMTSTMLYNSRKAYDSEFYTPANFYADVAVSKEFNKQWLVEAKYHDIAGQHTGTRAVTVGVTYYWGNK